MGNKLLFFLYKEAMVLTSYILASAPFTFVELALLVFKDLPQTERNIIGPFNLHPEK